MIPRKVFLAYVLRAIAPYLDTLVLVGGFAAGLYRFHPRAAPTELVALRTFDADFAAPNRLEIQAGQTLSDLVAGAGLHPQLFGEYDPPVMKFFPRNTGGDTPSATAEQYCVEFLTPLIGSETDRAGKEVPTRDIQRGITAQRLRYLDILLVDPWQIPVARFLGARSEDDEARVRIPHPGLFIVQKILISDERRRHGDRPKDMAYIYEVLGLFRRDIATLAREVRGTMAQNHSWQKWLERFKVTAVELFGTTNAPGVTEAHGVLAAAGAGGDAPTPQMILAAVQAFLKSF